MPITLSFLGASVFAVAVAWWLRRISERALKSAHSSAARRDGIRCVHLARRTNLPVTILHARVRHRKARAGLHVARGGILYGLRATDVVIFEPWRNGAFTIVCPGTAAASAGRILERLEDLLFADGHLVSFGFASFPEDAYTFEGLCEVARKRADMRPATREAKPPPPSAAARRVANLVPERLPK